MRLLAAAASNCGTEQARVIQQECIGSLSNRNSDHGPSAREDHDPTETVHFLVGSNEVSITTLSRHTL